MSWTAACIVKAAMNTQPKVYVYVLRSLLSGSRPYVGLTSNMAARLAAHNAGRSPHTARYKAWRVAV